MAKRIIKEANQTVIAKRVNQLVQILTVSYNGTRQQLFDMLKNKEIDKSEKLWNIEFEMFKKYLQKANKVLCEGTKKSNEYYIARSLKRYDDLYQRAYQEKDYKLAATIQKQLETLQMIGYYSKPQNENNITIQNNLPNKLVIEVVETDYNDYKLNDGTTDKN